MELPSAKDATRRHNNINDNKQIDNGNTNVNNRNSSVDDDTGRIHTNKPPSAKGRADPTLPTSTWCYSIT